MILSTCRHGIASGKISEFLTPSLPLGIRLCPDQSSSGGEVMGLVLTCLPALQAPNTGTSSRADFVEVSAHCSQHPSPISWNPTYSPYLFACPAGCSRLNLSAAINFESWCVCACSGFRGLCAGTDGKAHVRVERGQGGLLLRLPLPHWYQLHRCGLCLCLCLSSWLPWLAVSAALCCCVLALPPLCCHH